MNIQDTSRVLNAVAQDYVPLDVNLLPRILSSLEKKNDARLKSRRASLALIVLVAVLVLVMAAISIPAVAEALQHMFGFIPGVGLLDGNLEGYGGNGFHSGTNFVSNGQRNATAEVRRSFNGSYPPLYQAAYLIGALQLRNLHKDLVDSGQMTNKQFHDSIIHNGSMPIAMIRLSVSKEKLTPDTPVDWKFYGPNPGK